VTTILRVLAVPAVGAGYCEDLAALQAEYVPLPERFRAAPVTPGFRAVREVAEAVSIGLVLDTGQVTWGDCVAVSYSGGSGRGPVFRTEQGLATVEQAVAPGLEGRELTSFRALAAELEDWVEPVQIDRPLPDASPAGEEGLSRRALLAAPARALQATRSGSRTGTEQVTVERPLHPAIRYGTSQALLQAVALDRRQTMAEVIAEEWGLPTPDSAIPIHAQSGSERYYNAEKMIARRIASLPHALVDDVEGQVGREGVELIRYIRWLAGRIRQLGGDDYYPTIHLDLHGALGQIYENKLGQVLGQLYAMERAAKPYRLRIECPLLLASREAQITELKMLREYVRLRNMQVELVADEWANTLEDIRAFVDAEAVDMIQIKMPDLGGVDNTIEAVLACKEAGIGAFLGGSYAETNLSARVSVHVALATRPDCIMAKPGMGVDEAVSLVQNEMSRSLAAIRTRAG
jgi:methylaspartate ammonia-lyase